MPAPPEFGGVESAAVQGRPMRLMMGLPVREITLVGIVAGYPAQGVPALPPDGQQTGKPPGAGSQAAGGEIT